MGLTWIDYDSIEKPIEEITLGTDEAVDIEFKVETLKSTAVSNESKKSCYNKKVKESLSPSSSSNYLRSSDETNIDLHVRSMLMSYISQSFLNL